MAKRLADKPFAIIGINSDEGQAALRDMLKDEGIEWRQALDGSTSGPIASKWSIQGWPTIFILDGQGVIRHVSLGDDGQTEGIVDRLLQGL